MSTQNAAHITSATQQASKPSIFEVLAQESLLGAIRPALKHAVKVVAESRPDRLGWLLRWYDEIYTILDWALQRHYLKTYCGSFAENFYGIKRVPSSCQGKPPKCLPRKEFILSLLFLVIFPYIKHKMDEKFEEIRHRHNTGHMSQVRSINQLYRLMLWVYPYVHASYEGTVLCYNMAYMLDKSKWHSPLLHVAGVQLLNQDLEDMEPSTPSDSTVPSASFQERVCHLLRQGSKVTVTALSSAFTVGVFFLQFLDWWYSSDNTAAAIVTTHIPAAPKADESVEVPPFNVCPICERIRTNDTTLSVSGYVFCFPCIDDHVRKYHCCPVTHYPATTKHLIKLYLQDT